MFKSERNFQNYEVLLAVKTGFLCQEVTVTVRQFPPMAEHLYVNYPEKDTDCLQRFHNNHRFYINSSGFEGLDTH